MALDRGADGARSAASSRRVELTNTRIRWSGVRITGSRAPSHEHIMARCGLRSHPARRASGARVAVARAFASIARARMSADVWLSSTSRPRSMRLRPAVLAATPRRSAARSRNARVVDECRVGRTWSPAGGSSRRLLRVPPARSRSPLQRGDRARNPRSHKRTPSSTTRGTSSAAAEDKASRSTLAKAIERGHDYSRSRRRRLRARRRRRTRARRRSEAEAPRGCERRSIGP